MSTRGSIAISGQRYRGEGDSGQAPHAIADPRVADHVGLHRQHEHSRERPGDPGGAPPAGAARGAHDPGQQSESPRRPEQRAEQTGLGAELRVVRLAGFDRRPRPGSGLAGVAEPVALWVVHDRAHALAETDPVTVNGRLVDAIGVAAGSRLRPCMVPLLHQIPLRPLTGRRDVWEHVHPRNAHRERRDRGSDRPPAPRGESEHEQAGRECQQRRTREREEQSREDHRAQRDEDARPSQERRTQQQRNDEQVRARERSEERRDEPSIEPVDIAPVVEHEVLRETTGAVVVVAELLVEVIDDGRVAPPRDRNEEIVEEPEHRDRGCRTDDRPGDADKIVASEDHRPAEEVGADRNEVVLQCEPDRGPVGSPAEPVLPPAVPGASGLPAALPVRHSDRPAVRTPLRPAGRRRDGGGGLRPLPGPLGGGGPGHRRPDLPRAAS